MEEFKNERKEHAMNLIEAEVLTAEDIVINESEKANGNN